MNYIDGLVIAVPTANREAYKLYSENFAPIFKKFGALSVVDCWGSDVPSGELTSFPLAVQCKEDETVVFSWISWPSKEVRDAAWEVMMSDPHFSQEVNPMPFDGKRMIYGGFEKLVEM